jgi:hypothetical protein
MLVVNKKDTVDSTYTGNVYLFIDELPSRDYTLPNQGRYQFLATDKGRKLFSQGLIINATGTFTITATNYDKTIVGTHKVTVT